MINDYIKKNRRYFIEELSDFISIRSIATEKEKIKLIVKKLVNKFEKLNFKTKIVNINNSNPFILAESGEGERTLLIYDHYDVMSEGDIKYWKTPPFQLIKKNGYWYGRGLADNKGHLVLRLQAIESVLKIFKKLPIKIKFLIEGEEEIGSPHIHKFSEKFADFLRRSDLCLWESGDIGENGAPQMFLGMKGIAYFLLSCTLGKKDLHSGYASLVDSAAWRLIYALSTIRDTKGNILIDKLNKEKVYPEDFELNLIKKQKISLKELLNSLGHKRFLGQRKLKTEVLINHYFGLTCNICGIWSGTVNKNEIKTILPHKAFAKIDFRLVKNIDSKKVFSYLKNHFSKNGFFDIEIKELISEPVAYTDYKNVVFQKAVKIISQSYGKEVEISPYAKGSGPMYYVASQFGIPCIQLGAQRISSNIHGPNENIKESDYFKALKAMTDLVVNL